MLHSARTETLIGAAVLMVGVLVMVWASVGRPALEGADGVYMVSAVFNRADGVGVGSEVRLAGLPIGKVVGHRLDDSYRAVVSMRLDLDIELPDDTAALIQTDGLLGAKYIELSTGGAGYGTVPSGGQLLYSQDSVIIEDLLAKIVAMAKRRRGIDPDAPALEQDED